MPKKKTPNSEKNGWIRLWSKLSEERIWKDSSSAHKIVMITLLLMVCYGKKSIAWNGKLIKLKPGCMLVSLEEIKAQAGKGVSIQNIRSALNRFENKYNFLTQQTTNIGHYITIHNWKRRNSWGSDFLDYAKYYSCDRCKHKICEKDYYFSQKKKPFHLCNACAFKEGFFTEKKFLISCGIYLNSANAIVYNGGILIWFGRSPFSEHGRSSAETYKWRKAVLKRDNYTCQKCGWRKRNLIAHHIKPYAKYEKLRFEVSNGLTLCVPCHKKEHARLKNAFNN